MGIVQTLIQYTAHPITLLIYSCDELTAGVVG